MATLDGHEITVLTENPVYSVNITQHPVEQGIDLTDHVERMPTTLQLTGEIHGEDAAHKRKLFIDAMNVGYRMNYVGRNSFHQVVISSFTSEHDYKIANGMRFTMTLQEIRMADPSFAELYNAGLQQLANQPPPGTPRQHTMKRGETMYSIAPKYGTSWQTIVRLNPGVDPKKLQIGQNIRIA